MIEAAIWAAVLIYLVERLRPLGSRTIALYESKLKPVPAQENLPLDLARHVLTQSEQWAQEQTEQYIREQYAECRDWDKVRERVGLMRAADDRPSALH